jgi:hypothetical protein
LLTKRKLALAVARGAPWSPISYDLLTEAREFMADFMTHTRPSEKDDGDRDGLILSQSHWVVRGGGKDRPLFSRNLAEILKLAEIGGKTAAKCELSAPFFFLFFLTKS